MSTNYLADTDRLADEHLLAEPAAAAYLTLQPQTLSAWRLRGCGPPYVRLGRAVRYRIADLRAYIASRTVQSTSEADSLSR